MADEKTTTEQTSAEQTSDAPEVATREETAEQTDESAAGAADDPRGPIPMDDEGNIIPTPGDVRTEPVSTAAESHVKGRVGPPSIQQDAAAPYHTGEGVEQIKPGQVMPAGTVIEGGPVAYAVPDPATFGAGPYGGDTPADESPATVHATKPGTDLPGAAELPAGVPVPSSLASTGGPVTSPPTSAAPAETSESAGAAPSGESGAATPDDDEPAPTGKRAARTSTSSDSG